MANYADYIQFPDTMINGNYVERYAFPDSTGMYTDSTAWYSTPEGYKVVDRSDAKLYKQDHPEGRPYVAQTYTEEERQKLFNDAFGKSKIEDVEQKSDGGILSQAPKELVELVQAAMSDESAAKKLSQLMSQRPDLTDMVEQIAAELQGTQEMKCGGRVKKKALGSKLIKTQKAKCGCELKKVGGRLIEVDSCTGLPVHRNGGNVVKLQTAWTAIPTMQMPYNPEAHRDPLLDSIIRTDMARKQTAKQEAEKAKLEREASARAAFDGSFMAGGLNYGKSNPLNLTRTATQKTDVPSYILTDRSTLRSPSTRSIDPSAANGTQNKVDNEQSQKVAESTTSKPLFADPNLRSLAQREQWVKNNKDYLSANGWTEDEINNYRGQTAAINYKLRDAMNAKSAWDAEQEAAHQAAVAQRADDQQRQQKFVEEIAPSHPLEKAAIIPPKTSAIVKPQGLQPTAEQIKSNTLTAMLGQNTSDRRMAKYSKAYDFIKTGANAANMSAADTRRANRLATKMHKAGLMENGGQLNYANYLN